MTATELQAMQNAAASSAMEGLPYEQRHIDMIKRILAGKLTVAEYLAQIKEQYGDAQ